MKLRYGNIIIFCLLAILVSIACYQIFSLGYLNDEWLQLGYVHGVGLFAGFSDKLSLPAILMGKGRFLGGMLNNLFLYYSGENPMPFAIFAIMFQIINSYLVYLVTKEITKKQSIAILTACVFSIPAAAHQSLSWFAATTQTLGGLTFVLLSVLAAIQGLKKNNLLIHIASWILAYIAFLFKESSFFVFPLLLILPDVMPVHVKLAHTKQRLFVAFLCILFGIYKILQFFGTTAPNTSVVSKALLNMVMYPLISFGQFFIPFRFMLRFSLAFAPYFYSFMAGATESNQAASVIVSDMLSIIFSFVLLLILLFMLLKKKNIRKSVVFAAAWYVMSFFPMAVFLPERNTSYLESRYLYFAFFPVALIMGIILYEIKNWLASRLNSTKTAWGITILLLSLFLYKQITLVQREIRQNIAYGAATKAAMTAIRSLYPTLPDKPIFLVEGDKKFYYANINLPFQEGAGYMLALTFMDYPAISNELLGINYLAKHEAQGYKEVGNKGIGYFWDRNDLLKFFQDHPNISADQIVGMYYYGFTGKLVDTTSPVREFVDTHRYSANMGL